MSFLVSWTRRTVVSILAAVLFCGSNLAVAATGKECMERYRACKAESGADLLCMLAMADCSATATTDLQDDTLSGDGEATNRRSPPRTQLDIDFDLGDDLDW